MSAAITRPASQPVSGGRFLAAALAAGLTIAGLGLVASNVAAPKSAPQAQTTAPFVDRDKFVGPTKAEYYTPGGWNPGPRVVDDPLVRLVERGNHRIAW
jgi:hypothetical protein